MTDDAGPTSASRPNFVIGIGASAGGLDTLQEVLAPLRPGLGAAIVVAQHLSPDHPSLIVELLARDCPLPVTVAQDGFPLIADTIIVGPPNSDVVIEGEIVRLVPPTPRFTPSPSIDLLFESLAEHWDEKAIAVVLSGTGSDGAHGLRAIRGAGGLTLVQDPATARFDGMPRAAISLGGAQVIESAGDIGVRLAGIGSPQSFDIPSTSQVAPAADMLLTITAQLRRAVGIDFSRYKESTLRRQLQRRMAVRQVADVDDYYALLAQDPEEAHALCSNLLVTVTSFFRDSDAFEALKDRLADYVESVGTDEQLRVWVPGCATGEEVYTIAMIASEVLGFPANLDQHLKIFGTDLDETSLALARRARYSIAAASRIPAGYREQFVIEMPDGVQVTDALRECTVFARHDVGDDPPFPRLDLISCRNTLIYFTTPLQQRVLQLFSYALKTGGLLFLGRSETLEHATRAFDTVDGEHRIFMRNEETLSRPELIDAGWGGRPLRPIAAPARVAVVHDPGLESHADLLEALVRATSPACLVLDESHNLVEVVGDVSRFCQVPQGRVPAAVGSYLRPELQDEARALFLMCRADGAPAEGRIIELEKPAARVRLRVTPMSVGDRDMWILAFYEVLQAVDLPSPDRGAVFDREIKRLEHELFESQDAMRRSLAELQAANEELEASSEELQAASEELQAANEELEASNEELQATNEEIGSVNQELRVKGEELQRVNTDLENVQASLSQGMVLLDSDTRITRFTPLAVRVFALVASDLGRPLAEVPTTVDVDGLHDAIGAVLAGDGRRSIECGNTTVSYLIQVLPYVALDGARLGAIVTLTDVTDIVTLRTVAEQALEEVQAKSDLLQQQATYDALTGLLNRGRFHESVAREMARAGRTHSRLALVVVDIDRFKEVNDAHGHDAGDFVLRSAADRILACVRGSDIVGRIGGDEFAIIVDDFSMEVELETVLERIVEALHQPVSLHDREILVSGSVGVAIYPDDDQTPDGLMRAADAAMYSAKKLAGDTYVYFDASLNQSADNRRTMRQEIETALARSQFSLHYQPIVSAHDGTVWGVESLIRWERNGAILTADEFIPFCQDSGQIRALALVSLGLLRNDLVALRAAGHLGLKASVNLSATQLEDSHLAELVKSWPMPAGLEGIVIEVVESVFLPEHGRALDLLTHLTDLGAQVSIDDYGSGYSNFHLLDKLSPAYIKLDRSFLSERVLPDARSALITAAVEMSHVFGAEVIAEGIENAEEQALVTELGVEYLQGYAIARPMALPELIAWLDARPITPR